MQAMKEVIKSSLNSSDEWYDKQLYGWCGAIQRQRQLQRSQYQMQYSQPVQRIAVSIVFLLCLIGKLLVWPCLLNLSSHVCMHVYTFMVCNFSWTTYYYHIPFLLIIFLCFFCTSKYHVRIVYMECNFELCNFGVTLSFNNN